MVGHRIALEVAHVFGGDTARAVCHVKVLEAVCVVADCGLNREVHPVVGRHDAIVGTGLEHAIGLGPCRAQARTH